MKRQNKTTLVEKLKNLVAGSGDKSIAESRGFLTCQDMLDFDAYDGGHAVSLETLQRLESRYAEKVDTSKLMKELERKGGGALCYYGLALMAQYDLSKKEGNPNTAKFANSREYVRHVLQKTDSFMDETKSIRSVFDEDKKAGKEYTQTFEDSTDFAVKLIKKEKEVQK